MKNRILNIDWPFFVHEGYIVSDSIVVNIHRTENGFVKVTYVYNFSTNTAYRMTQP